MDITLVTLNLSKLWPGYMIAKEKIEKHCLLHGFSAKLFQFWLSLVIDKNSLYTHNQLYLIILANIWHWQIDHISLLIFYKLKKECLEIKLEDKTLFQCAYYAFSKIF